MYIKQVTVYSVLPGSHPWGTVACPAAHRWWSGSSSAQAHSRSPEARWSSVLPERNKSKSVHQQVTKNVARAVFVPLNRRHPLADNCTPNKGISVARPGLQAAIVFNWQRREGGWCWTGGWTGEGLRAPLYQPLCHELTITSPPQYRRKPGRTFLPY